MGLDMYLTKSHYVQKWDHQKDEEKFEVTVNRGGEEYSRINSDKITYIEEEAGYWRKANAIHGWFVENVQGGIDNCNRFRVHGRHIEELYSACKSVLENPSKASEELSTRSGFFFGSTDYDEWYIRDLEYTAEVCEELLKDLDDNGYFPYDLYYEASW